MKNYQKGFISITLLIIIGLLVVGGGVYYYHAKVSTKMADTSEVSLNTNFGENTQLNDYNNSDTKVNTNTVVNTSINTAVNTSTTTTKVKIALLAEPQKDGDEKKLKGCDLVSLVERTVPYTTAPLNAAFKELFAKKEPWPYSETYSGNFISSQKNLLFDRATIENGVAKIYLTGRLEPQAGVCDGPRLRTQIDATAFQFSTVGSVEIYLNGTRIEMIGQSSECNLRVTSISPNSQVSFPLTIRGDVNTKSGCAWNIFEGQAGIAQLYYNYNNQGWKPIGVSVAIKPEYNTPIGFHFNLTLNFNNSGIGLPSGTPMKIIFTAENAAAISPSVAVEVLIVLK